jgi:hypothetical protein
VLHNKILCNDEAVRTLVLIRNKLIRQDPSIQQPFASSQGETYQFGIQFFQTLQGMLSALNLRRVTAQTHALLHEFHDLVDSPAIATASWRDRTQ